MANNKSMFSLRIEKNLLDNIKIFAKEDGRSTNKEIEHVLKIHIEQRNK